MRGTSTSSTARSRRSFRRARRRASSCSPGSASCSASAYVCARPERGGPPPGGLEKRLQLLPEVSLHVGAVAHRPLGGTPVLEDDQGRDGHDAELARRSGVGVDVHLQELHPASQLLGDLFDDRGDHAAGCAPGGPEVDQYRLPGPPPQGGRNGGGKGGGSK